LPGLLAALPGATLKTLILHDVGLGGSASPEHMGLFGRLTGLAALNLGFNGLRPEQATALCQALVHTTSLCKLSLVGNPLLLDASEAEVDAAVRRICVRMTGKSVDRRYLSWIIIESGRYGNSALRAMHRSTPKLVTSENSSSQSFKLGLLTYGV
jgi:hypothetical protein